MLPANQEETVPGGWTTAGAVMLAVTGTAQAVFGVLAIAGIDQLRENIREIETDGRELYLSLDGWGVFLLLLAALQLLAAYRLLRRTPYARTLGLTAALFALGLSFFTLALFRAASVVVAVVLLFALYVLSYQVT